MNKKESLLEATMKAIINENNKFYHYDDDNYKINDIIKKSNSVSLDIAKIYKDVLNMDANKFIYVKKT